MYSITETFMLSSSTRHSAKPVPWSSRWLKVVFGGGRKTATLAASIAVPYFFTNPHFRNSFPRLFPLQRPLFPAEGREGREKRPHKDFMNRLMKGAPRTCCSCPQLRRLLHLFCPIRTCWFFFSQPDFTHFLEFISLLRCQDTFDVLRAIHRKPSFADL